MKTLITAILLLTNIAYGQESITKIKDTLIISRGGGFSEFTHTGALMQSKRKALKNAKKNCEKSFDKKTCSNLVKVNFFNNSRRTNECGGSLLPTCLFSDATYISKPKSLAAVKNIIIDRELKSTEVKSCLLAYGNNAVLVVDFTFNSTVAAVLNPTIIKTSKDVRNAMKYFEMFKNDSGENFYKLNLTNFVITNFEREIKNSRAEVTNIQREALEKEINGSLEETCDELRAEVEKLNRSFEAPYYPDFFNMIAF